jgi:hypothetical protein
VRSLFALIFGACATLCLAQPEGEYQGQKWSINKSNALIWDGKPYLPVGARVSSSELDDWLKSTVRDYAIEVPEGGMDLAATVKKLETAKARYAITFNSVAPLARGFAVDPDAFRILGITSPRRIKFKIPNCSSALAVLITRRDADIQTVARVMTPGGNFEFDAKPLNDLEHVLYVYPETESLEVPDFWERFDARRDRVLSQLKNNLPGPGLRAIINPLGITAPVNAIDVRFVPNSAYFKIEFRKYLEDKYRNVETLQRSWSMRANDISDWDTMARLVPLWSTDLGGLSMIWDPATDQTYFADSKRSQIWKDVREMISSTAARRTERLRKAIRELCNVPVVQEWNGWSVLTDGGAAPLDGLGMVVAGPSATMIANTGSRATSSILRWGRPGLLFATDFQVDNTVPFTPAAVDDVISLGARGIYIDHPTGATKTWLQTNPKLDDATADMDTRAIFFPENALNPAQPQRLPNGIWWLPSPVAGNRIDFGRDFFGYRFEDGGQTKTVFWTTLPAGRYKIDIPNAKTTSFESTDGSDLKIKYLKTGVELTLSNFPIIVSGNNDYPIPSLAVQEMNAKYLALVSLMTEAGRVASEERYLYGAPLSTYDTNPGPSYTEMRNQYNKLSIRLAKWTWIEAESSREHSFNGSFTDYGCSGNRALVVRNRVEGDRASFEANYSVQQRTDAEQEVWVAAKVPPGNPECLSMRIGGQVMIASGPPISVYGSGFGWYKLGTTKFAEGLTKITIVAAPAAKTEVQVDAIMITPVSFIPNGIFIPDPIDFRAKRGPIKPGVRR